MELFKNIMNDILKLSYGVLCLLISLYFIYLIITVLVITLSEKDWLSLISAAIYSLTIYSLWMPLFIKNKIYINAALFLLFIIFFKLFFYLPFVKHSLDMSLCLDTGICAENLETNTNYGKVLINEYNCSKYQWKWDNEMRRCHIDN